MIGGLIIRGSNGETRVSFPTHMNPIPAAVGVKK